MDLRRALPFGAGGQGSVARISRAAGFRWADPIAAIGILAANEGLEAWRGENCDDDHCDD